MRTSTRLPPGFFSTAYTTNSMSEPSYRPLSSPSASGVRSASAIVLCSRLPVDASYFFAKPSVARPDG